MTTRSQTKKKKGKARTGGHRDGRELDGFVENNVEAQSLRFNGGDGGKRGGKSRKNVGFGKADNSKSPRKPGNSTKGSAKAAKGSKVSKSLKSGRPSPADYRRGKFRGTKAAFDEKFEEFKGKGFTERMKIPGAEVTLTMDDMGATEFVWNDVLSKVRNTKAKAKKDGFTEPPPAAVYDEGDGGYERDVDAIGGEDDDEFLDFDEVIVNEVNEVSVNKELGGKFEDAFVDPASPARSATHRNGEASAATPAFDETKASSSASGLGLSYQYCSELSGTSGAELSAASGAEMSAASGPDSPTRPGKKKRIRKKDKTKTEAWPEVQPTYEPVIDEEAKAAGKNKPYKVSFTSVKIDSFERQLSNVAVPCDGHWPLGLGDRVEEESFVGPLAVFEARRQHELHDRAARLGEEVAKGEILYTKQIDFKRKVSNPLFGMKKTRERKAILLTTVDPSYIPDQNDGKRRTRGLSDADLEKDTTALDAAVKTEEEISQEMKELINRNQHLGCSCKKLKMKGMKEARIRSELSLRDVDHKKLTKIEAHDALKDIAATEDCCSVGCECHRDGLGCHFEICACREFPKCGNPFGRLDYDADSVKKYRLKVIQSLAQSG